MKPKIMDETKNTNEDNAIAFFRSMGIEPIVIDPNNPESVSQGLNQVTERIVEFTTSDKPVENNQQNDGNSNE